MPRASIRLIRFSGCAAAAMLLAACGTPETESNATNAVTAMPPPTGAPSTPVADGLASVAQTGDSDAEIRQFLAALYAPYARDGADPGLVAQRDIFDARLGDLLARDLAQAGDELPAMDYDPLCNCQDFGGLRHEVSKLVVNGDRATAEVTITNFGQRSRLTYMLARTQDGWRIADIATKDVPSLAGLLTNAAGR